MLASCLLMVPLLLLGAGQSVAEESPAKTPAGPPAAPELMEAGLAGSGELVKLSVFPPRVEIRGSDRTASLVVTGLYANGGARDLTSEASASITGPAIVRVDPSGLVTPLSDGSGELKVAVGPVSASVSATVSHTGLDLPINFSNDIVPIFSKYGCNSGGCHGKSGGQNGFQLSLFGFTPLIDYNSLTRESRARRVFPAAPEHSLLLRKATGGLPHGGGERFKAGSPEYQLLHRWMRSGMPLGKPDDPTLTGISVYPRHRTLARGRRQQLAVTALYSDGQTEDVTRRAEYSAGEGDYLGVAPTGLVTAFDLVGQGTVLVRYKGQVGLFRATIPSGADLSRLVFPAEKNFIDRHVFARLRLLGIPASALSSDSEFLRRVSLDVCGTLPRAEEAARFLDDPDPGKREKLIDRLLEQPEYASYFTLFWADLLRNQRGGEQKVAPQTIGFHRWLYEGLYQSRPFDGLVRELLCAEGSVSDNPAVAWYRTLENPKELVDDTAQVFLGTRLQCARCHHHPFEKWSQDDYWRFANFFSRVNRKNERNSRGFTISLRRGTSRLGDDEPTSASFKKTYDGLKLPGGPALAESAEDDPRERLVQWMVSPENPLFARAVVNRYWKHFLGRGIVEPEDDLRETNPPSNPELLDGLAADFQKSGYDLKHLIRTICGSATYQLSPEPVEGNQADRQSFARFQPRRLGAEVLLDGLDQVTGTKTRFSGVLRGARAIELPDESSRSYFLEIFGKPDRSSACACERSEGVTLSQVLHLLNSREMQDKLSSGEGRAAVLAKDPRPDAEKVRELFLWVYSRRPSELELEKALSHLAAHTDPKNAEASRRKAWEDLLWVLLNSKEFLFQL